ncbi:MAG TPA: hypothetical protein PKD90_11090, partial [Phnomibacter sp.]|nr:hypothetical protein [Phnomibacter sp.]
PSLKGAYGPWKLQGLPGVILEAEDERKEVVFKAVSILALSPLEEIRLPSDLVVATQQQFDRYKASADKSRAGGSTTGVSISNVKLDGGTAPNQPKIKFNNPLEKQ